MGPQCPIGTVAGRGTTLATAPASRSQRRASVTFCVLFTLATMALIPLATHIRAPSRPFYDLADHRERHYALATSPAVQPFSADPAWSLLWVDAGTFTPQLFCSCNS